jgi:arylsulfatase A-like enzyme
MHPNILLIVMDAARAENLSCYGYSRPTTPNLEQFATHSVVYEMAISPAGWTLPAHASMFTGLYPSRHGADDQHKFLSPESPTMAELLRALGYITLAYCYNAYVGPATGLNRGFQSFSNRLIHAPNGLGKVISRMDRGTARVMGWRDSGARYINAQVIKALRQLQSDDRPFFIFINYLEPHVPYRSPRKYNRYLPDTISPKELKELNLDPWKYLTDPASMDERDFEILRSLHDSAITYLDTRIAEVLNWLKELRLLDDTMVIITADHGENLGDHQLMGHGYCLYDSLLHVPLIIHYPKGIVTPGRVTHQVQTLDLLPTILALVEETSTEAYDSLQGYNLLSSTRRDFTVAEQSKPDLTNFYSRFPDVDVSRFDRALKMIRTERHKYIHASDGRHELYDLQADPGEVRSIVGEQPNIAGDLDLRLTEWYARFEPILPADQAPEFDEEVKARLRALGYLE